MPTKTELVAKKTLADFISSRVKARQEAYERKYHMKLSWAAISRELGMDNETFRRLYYGEGNGNITTDNAVRLILHPLFGPKTADHLEYSGGIYTRDALISVAEMTKMKPEDQQQIASDILAKREEETEETSDPSSTSWTVQES